MGRLDTTLARGERKRKKRKRVGLQGGLGHLPLQPRLGSQLQAAKGNDGKGTEGLGRLPALVVARGEGCQESGDARAADCSEKVVRPRGQANH